MIPDNFRFCSAIFLLINCNIHRKLSLTSSENKPSNERGNHIIQLDGLRFIAVSTILTAHWFQWQWSNLVFKNLPLVHGVNLFFVLSGFLISDILLSNRKKAEVNKLSGSHILKRFYIRRILRIFPVYYLFIGGLYVFDYANTRELFPWLISYTSNIYQSIKGVSIGEFNHFWSLAVEEQFYLVWPFLVLFVSRSLLKWAIGLVILLSLSTKVYFYWEGFNWMANSYSTLTCMHLFGLGAFLALLKQEHPKICNAFSNPLLVWVTIFMYAAFFTLQTFFKWDSIKVIFDDFLFGICSFFIISVASENKFRGLSRAILENPVVVRIGKISYGMYIVHLFIPSFYCYLIPKFNVTIYNPWIIFLVMYGLTFSIASLSWELIEKPINRLKSKFEYTSST